MEKNKADQQASPQKLPLNSTSLHSQQGRFLNRWQAGPVEIAAARNDHHITMLAAGVRPAREPEQSANLPSTMLPIPQNAAGATMSTQEIARLTGKQHKNVIRDVRSMLSALAADGSEVSHVREERDSRGYATNYHLDRELTETLITGYDVALRHRVIRRLHELESQVVGLIALPTNLPQALRMAAELAELVVEQAPKLAAFELLQGAGGTLNLTSAAAHLGIKRNRLIRWLSENRWMYRCAKTKPWLAYQVRIQHGLVANKVSVIGTTEEGDARCASQFRITPKGMAILASKVVEGAL